MTKPNTTDEVNEEQPPLSSLEEVAALRSVYEAAIDVTYHCKQILIQDGKRITGVAALNAAMRNYESIAETRSALRAAPDGDGVPGLLPCASCAALPQLHHDHHCFRDAEGWQIRCDNCGLQTCWWHTKAEAFERWNARASVSPAQQWQPIESVPRDGGALMLFLSHPTDYKPNLADGLVWISAGNYYGQATHWRPLPDPPTA